ncbi:MAG TPA: hypothetical protein VGG13_01835 [Candidatus Saccharimonadales bacterium]|jgi:hypothetical protein
MTQKGTVKPGKLEDNPLWREASDLAEYMYSRLVLFPPDEKWDTVRKIRSSANDLMFDVGQAVSNTIPIGAEYEWGNASKHLGGLKTMYRFACRQGFLELEPKIMVRLDKLVEQIQSEIANAAEKTKLNEEHQLNLWREQYRLWREMYVDDFHKPAGHHHEG